MADRNATWYTYCMTQLVTRIPELVAAEIDRLVASGSFESRSDLVREALVFYLDRLRRDEIGRQIVEGYLRIPETEEELRWAEVAGREMVEEEPW